MSWFCCAMKAGSTSGVRHFGFRNWPLSAMIVANVLLGQFRNPKCLTPAGAQQIPEEHNLSSRPSFHQPRVAPQSALRRGKSDGGDTCNPVGSASLGVRQEIAYPSKPDAQAKDAGQRILRLRVRLQSAVRQFLPVALMTARQFFRVAASPRLRQLLPEVVCSRIEPSDREAALVGRDVAVCEVAPPSSATDRQVKGPQ